MTPAFQGCLVMVLALALAALALALAFDCCKTRRGGDGMRERVPCVKSGNFLGLLLLTPTATVTVTDAVTTQIKMWLKCGREPCTCEGSSAAREGEAIN